MVKKNPLTWYYKWNEWDKSEWDFLFFVFIHNDSIQAQAEDAEVNVASSAKDLNMKQK